MTRAKALLVSFFFAMLLTAIVPEVMACSVCGGASDSPMAQGMNWGIFSLLIVIVSMLLGIAGFFVFLARKSAQTASAATTQQLSLETKND
jgi:hypothetical protein